MNLKEFYSPQDNQELSLIEKYKNIVIVSKDVKPNRVKLEVFNEGEKTTEIKIPYSKLEIYLNNLKSNNKKLKVINNED